MKTPPAGERFESSTEQLVDETIEESFPASDPPSWTLGVIVPPGAAWPKRDGHAEDGSS